jgi:hypothetical protein
MEIFVAVSFHKNRDPEAARHVVQLGIRKFEDTARFTR